MNPLPSPWLLLSGIITLFVIKLIFDSHNAGLSHIPGPFIARYTDAWRFVVAWRSVQHGGTSERIRQKYGDVVRIGPKTVVVFDPAAIPVIYGLTTRLAKSNAYEVFAPPGVGPSLLASLDQDSHDRLKRPLANAYAMSSIKGYESNVDLVLETLTKALSQLAEAGKMVNISEWCHFYAYDIVAKLTFGDKIGFLDEGKDVYNLVKTQKNASFYAATVSQMPWLDYIFKKNALLARVRPSPFVVFAAGKVQDRLRNPPNPGATRPDLLAHYVAAQEKHPEVMTARRITVVAAGNLFAGSQSPSRVFDTIFRFLATHPEAQEKLNAELSAAGCEYPIPFSQAQDLPYLDGVVREGYRLHGIGFFTMERIAPSSGLSLPSGQYLPAGTRVGTTTSGLNLRQDAFGDDAVVFKPERWIRGMDEGEEVFHDRRRLMERCDSSFGYGSRACIGKNIANLETYKVVATLIGMFKMTLVEKPTSLNVKVSLQRRRC